MQLQMTLSVCKLALSKLHRVGIKHGDVKKHNFLVQDGQATLIDFDVAMGCVDFEALDEELWSLPEMLQDTSGRGGMVVESGG